MYQKTLKEISLCKKIFESKLEEKLNIIKVPNPLFVRSDSGLQDNLTGSEKAISFAKNGDEFEIVHSLAKWKRVALGKYGFAMHSGLYANMKAIRQGETVDPLHSLYVEQWDFEKVISKEDRNIDYLKKTVREIYEAFKETAEVLGNNRLELPEEISFITSEELLQKYPKLTPKQRENAYGKEVKAYFLIGIGGLLSNGQPHDLRSPDYDDWALNGDLMIYDPVLKETIEISSMGIRVDERSLFDQLRRAHAEDRMTLPYHQMILNRKVPYSIGGGIGESRVYLLLLNKHHIAEVQASSWEKRVSEELKELEML